MKRSAGTNRVSRGAPQPIELRSDAVDETRRLGEMLGGLLVPGDVVLLHGALGAGKTAFAQGIARGLGVTGPVNSPTFTILKEYDGRLALYHFDLYRIDDPYELEALGFADYFDGAGACVVEWTERGEVNGDEATGPWPARWLRVRFAKRGPNERLLRLTAAGTRGRDLLVAFAQVARASEVA